MKINLITNKIVDSVESENYIDKSEARIAVSGGEEENVDITVVVRNDAGAKLGLANIKVKDDQIDVDIINGLNQQTRLTDEDLETLSMVFHEYKDYRRSDEESIRPAMALEQKIKALTGGRYTPDTTYDIKG